MGVVYEARHETLERRVALKVLLSGQEATVEDVQRFQLDAKAAARLEHPNVVRLFEHGRDPQGRWYMAMELVEGESLIGKLNRDGPLPARTAAELMLPIVRAMEAAHAQGILHRDLKPHNVLLTKD